MLFKQRTQFYQDKKIRIDPNDLGVSYTGTISTKKAEKVTFKNWLKKIN